MSKSIQQLQVERRKTRVRAKVFGTSQRPRLCVRRSLKNITVQAIDDVLGTVLCEASLKDMKDVKKPLEAASALGGAIAKKLTDKKISTVVFDRGSKKYHGRIQAVAEGARKGGLKF
jgi:large subunit ribosomal protein L18